MTLGHGGETCGDAVKEVARQLPGRFTGQEVVDKVKKMGSWSERNIWGHLITTVVNFPPSYRYWPNAKIERRCLFLREDGDYELYSPARHGRYDEGRRVV